MGNLKPVRLQDMDPVRPAERPLFRVMLGVDLRDGKRVLCPAVL